MPASTVLTGTIRESIATSVRSCLGVHKSSPLASTEESASTFLGSETGIGLGINDPETSCCTQDARRLLDGIMSPDDRLAAATWGALHHLLDAEGNPNPNTENHFTTWSGRIQNLLPRGISTHCAPRATPDALPSELPSAPLDSATFLEHEANAHLIPTTILFIPGRRTHPPTQTSQEAPLRGSYNLFAALGMVAITNDTHIWAIRIPEAQSQGATILDLRSEQGREEANLTQDQDLKWATATHGALISGTVPLSAYLAIGPDPAHHP